MTSSTQNLAPQLSQFHKATEFLKAHYEYRKKLDPGFSYEAWSAELGYKSRSFVKMVVSGQRSLTAEFVQNFAERMKFSSEDFHYFSLIVSHEQAGSEYERSLYLDKIFEHSGQRKQLQILEDQDDFLRDVHLPKIFLLLGFKDISKTPERLAEIMNMDVVSMKARLEKLEALGLVSFQNWQWEPVDESFRVPSKYGNEALETYHNSSLTEAMSAQKMETRLRRFRSLLLPLGESEFEELLTDIEALVGKSIAKYNHKEIQNRRLYKMNINVHPVTELVHEPENATGLSLKFENTET
ncbi:TIGR02147 family protein [Bdellovibrio sp. HCB209]|uniref:TIGR02147 family protein n=1 Tax=Bdellovibrio sp. HCB209 TaxID=3394354 RepID=UPI0039B39004